MPREGHTQFLDEATFQDHTQDEWYVKGFEDYAPTTTLVDIPVTDTGAGWKIELPEKTWAIIADITTAVYQKTEDGRLRYLGTDYIGDDDENGHPMVDMDDHWVHINGQLVCYEGKAVRDTDEKVTYTGEVKAKLNGKEDIILHIEWNSVPGSDGAEAVEKGVVTGYDLVNSDTPIFMRKGTEKLKTGDRINFVFDYYDEEGNLLSTETYGKTILVTKMEAISVTDDPLPDGDIEFLGVMTDVYQRKLMTETLYGQIGE